MTFWAHLGTAFLLEMAMMTGLWLVSVLLADVSIVDVVWSLLFVISGTYYESVTGQFSFSHIRRNLVALLVLLWALRLAAYLGLRKLGHGLTEDFRYQKFRRYWGAGYWWISYLQTFVLQTVFSVLISVALLVGALHPGQNALTALDLLGTAVWLVGFLFEAIADYQMYRFKRAPSTKPGALYTGGLWRYSRHPNYFGECLVWWGLWLVIAAGLYTAPLALATRVLLLLATLCCTPLFITWLLLRVSGVPLLEPKLQRAADERDKARYGNTSAFVPWPPRQ